MIFITPLKKCLTSLIAALLLVSHVAAQTAEQAAFDELQQRLYTLNYAPVNPALITPLRSALNADGSFADINYSSNRLEAYQLHLDRLVMFARALASGRLKDDAELFADFVSALDYWLTTDYRDPNWWWTYIGFPLRLAPVTALSAEKLRAPQPALYAMLIAYHTRVYTYSQANPHGYGANLSDMGYRALIGAIMDRDAAQMERVINNTFKVAIQMLGRANTRDGWRPDGTMFGHGPQLHNATYGREMALSASSALALLRGTHWDLGEEMLGLLEDQLLEAVMRMSYGSWFDFNAAGRAVSRPAGINLANGYSGIIETVLSLSPRNPERLQLLLDRIRNGPRAAHNFAGTKSFYYSDFITHIRRDYYTSVRMISNRTNRNEMLNGEGLQHLFFGDGIQFSLVHGDEYASIPPLWNYARLPGLTARQVSNLRPQASMGQRGSNAFANSVTDGRIGIAAMRLQHMETTGWKSWFLMDEGVVALGSGISVTSQTAPESVLTTLNQTRHSGPVRYQSRAGEPQTLAFAESHTGNDVNWIWHRDIGYVMLGDNDPLTFGAATVSGDWARIGASSGSVSGDVFSLYLDHGVRPVGKSYAYMVLPGSSEARTAALAASPPVRILRHDSWAHAVEHIATGTLHVAFLGANTLELDDGRSIHCDSPLLMLLKPHLGSWIVVTGDPLHNQTSATLELRGFELEGDGLIPLDAANHHYRLQIQFPQGDYRGSRVLQRFAIPGHALYQLGEPGSAAGGWSAFGGFAPVLEASEGWVYHQHSEWMYLRSDTPDDLYLYRPRDERWLWSSTSLPAIAYDFASGDWISLQLGTPPRELISIQ